MENSHLLSVIIFLPVLGAIWVALVPRSEKGIKTSALVFTAADFALSLAVFGLFDRSGTGFQLVEKGAWIPAVHAQYFLAVDGISICMVLLTAFLGFLSVLVSWVEIDLRVREYFAWLLLLETSILGVFCAQDFLLFFLFWEVEMIPMYFLISIWGTLPPLGRKEYSAIKYVLYTFIGSAMMLAGILLAYFNTGTWSMPELAETAPELSLGLRTLIFFLIFACFAVKLPMFPLHTWLPDAHTDAPTAGSVILAGVLIKMGGYGMIREVGIFPEIAKSYAFILVIFALINALYGAAVTLRQTDLKRLIAYSSISHMGYVLLGTFALSQLSLTGATLQMFSHGLITGMLFALVGLMHHKAHERRIPFLGGLARQMPIMAVVFSVAGLASLGLPTTSGFAAEFITFWGSFTSPVFPAIKICTVIAIFGVVITAGYMLWIIERVFYREPKSEYEGTSDLDPLELAMSSFFIAGIMLIGVYPRVLTDVINLGVLPLAKAIGL